MTDAPAGEGGALPDSWTVHRIPRSHYHCQLSNFHWEGVRPSSLRDRVAGFVGDLRDGRRPHLLMTGDPGIGKSHLGVALYRQGARLFGTQLCTWINVPSFCDAVKASYGTSGWDPFAEYREARRLVVLDDFFGRDLSQHEIGQVVYRLIDEAYQNQAAVVLTMNGDVTDLGARLRPHEVSRILGGAMIIPMKSDADWRRG